MFYQVLLSDNTSQICKRALFSLVLILSISISNLISQSHQFTNYTTEDGLPTNYVYGLIQDRDGFIWAYTENGIAKFDGYEWEVYNTGDGLPHNDVFLLKVDDKGNIIGQCYNETMFVISYKTKKIYSSPSRGFSISNGRVLIQKENRTLTTFENDAFKIADHRFEDLESLYNNMLKRAKNHPIVKSIKPSGQATYFKSSDNTYYFIIDKKNGQLIQFSGNENEIIKYKSKIAESAPVFMINKIFNNGFNIITSEGCLFFNEQATLEDSIFYRSYVHDGYEALASYKDIEGNIWMGTRNKGVIFIPAKNRLVRTFQGQQKRSFDKIEKSSNGHLFSTNEHGEFYALTAEGIELKYKPKERLRFRSFNYLQKNNSFYVSLSRHSYMLNENTLQEINFNKRYKTPKGISTEIYNSRYSDPQYDSGHFTDVKYDSIKKNYYVVDGRSHVLKCSQIEKLDLKYLFDNKNLKAYHDHKKSVFFSNFESLFFLDKSDKVKSYKLDLTDISFVFGLDETHFIIGTSANGLYKWNKTTNHQSKISDLNNIKSIRSINDKIFIVSFDGISIYAPEGKVESLLKATDGLASNESYDIAYQKPYYYVASIAGISRIDPKIFDYKNVTSPFNLKLSAHLEDQSITQNSKLQHTENDLQFNFQLSHFASGNKINYQYRLDPIDNEWRTTQERSVQFLDMNPGDYEFHLKTEDIYGNEYKAKEVFHFKIQKSWYTSWPFLAALIIASSLCLYYFISKREQRERNKIKDEMLIAQRMAELQLTALQTRMNPHFVFNALGSIQYFIQTNNVEQADRYLTSFASLMRMYLECSAEKMIPLSKEIELLKLFIDFELMRSDNKFSVNYKISDTIKNSDEQVPSMLLQPLVENSINFNLPMRKDGKAELHLAISKIADKLRIVIQDNGDNSRQITNGALFEHASQGLRNIYEKMEIIQKLEDIEIGLAYDTPFPHEKFKGTRVEMTLY